MARSGHKRMLLAHLPVRGGNGPFTREPRRLPFPIRSCLPCYPAPFMSRPREPAQRARADGCEALAFPAVQLFVERASESLENYELSDADASVVGDICRRLEGIALAIELAAIRVDSLGVR